MVGGGNDHVIAVRYVDGRLVSGADRFDQGQRESWIAREVL
jgi:hypothetical protein